MPRRTGNLDRHKCKSWKSNDGKAAMNPECHIRKEWKGSNQSRWNVGRKPLPLLLTPQLLEVGILLNNNSCHWSHIFVVEIHIWIGCARVSKTRPEWPGHAAAWNIYINSSYLESTCHRTASLSLLCCSVCSATLSSPVPSGSCGASENEVRERSAKAALCAIIMD